MGDFQLWYEQLPIISRTWITGSVVTAGLITFGLINPNNILLDFDHKIQVIYLKRYGDFSQIFSYSGNSVLTFYLTWCSYTSE